MPANAHVLFLPQRPYLPIASLRSAATYPASGNSFDDDAIREVLEAVGLGEFGERLDEVNNWSLQMSGGEQQRLAIARAVLQRPDWLSLDEATAALDDAAEQQVYTLLRDGSRVLRSSALRTGRASPHITRTTFASDRPRRQSHS